MSIVRGRCGVSIVNAGQFHGGINAIPAAPPGFFGTILFVGACVVDGNAAAQTPSSHRSLVEARLER